jgi:hypothetical protein
VRGSHRRCGLVALASVSTTAALLLLPAVAGAIPPSFTWSGAEPLGTPIFSNGEFDWSHGTNWGGTAPSGTVGTLTFPALTSPACTANSPTDTCYLGYNNVSGLSVNAISIDDGAFGAQVYSMTGEAITLGAGGLTASTSAGSGGAAQLELAITLGASQTWTIDGNSGHNGVTLGVGGFGHLTGASAALGVDLSHQAFFGVYQQDVEVGTVTITGGNPSDTGSAAIQNGDVYVGFGPTIGGSLNATDGNPVHLIDAELNVIDGTVGALTSTGGDLYVGLLGGVPSGGLAVAGGVTLDSASQVKLFINHAGTTARTDYSQLSASGNVNLGNAHLSLWDPNAEPDCPTLNPGDVDTLITTTGSLSGTFNGVPDGSTVTIGCTFNTGYGAPGIPPTVRINYTAHGVTATVLTAAVPPPVIVSLSPASKDFGSQDIFSGPTAAQTFTLTNPDGVILHVTAVSITGADSSQFNVAADSCTGATVTPGGTCTATVNFDPSTTGAKSANLAFTYDVSGSPQIVALTGTGTATPPVVPPPTPTTPPGGGSTGGGGNSTPPATGSVSLDGSTITVQSGRQAAVKLTCAGTATCSGKLTLTVRTKGKGKKKAKTRTIGTAAFSIAAGKTATIKITLNGTGGALLSAAHGHLSATLTMLKASPSPSTTQTQGVHLVQHKATKAKR